MSNTPLPAAGWYDDPQIPGLQRWFDGTRWTEHTQPSPAAMAQRHSMGPMTSSGLNVNREVVYTRQQTPHSVTKWVLISLLTGGIGLIWVVYYSVSPNHYWTA